MSRKTCFKDHSSCIYKITNAKNGKIYVGQTNDYQSRVLSHLSALRNNRACNGYLQASFNKYGEENFIFSIIERCDVDLLNEREEYWILKLESYNRVIGYNLNLGGGGVRGFHLSDETKEKIRIANTGRIVSEETRKRIRENHAHLRGKDNPNFGINRFATFSVEKQNEIRQKISYKVSGEKNPNYGKKMSEEQKRKLSESHKETLRKHGNPLKGRKRPEKSGANCYRAHAVVCVNTDEEFKTIDAASAKYNVLQSSISSCCSGKLHTAGLDEDGMRLVWRYKSDYTPMTHDEILHYLNDCDKQRYKSLSKNVRCISTGESFESMKDACIKYHLNASYLSAHCRGKAKSCGKHPVTREPLQWEYIE